MSGQARFVRLLLVCLLTAALIMIAAFAAHAESSHQACSPPECYPTEEPPSGGGGDGSWPGFSDGRLNPAMDEYYSVWCMGDHINVWGGLPSPQLIQSIPLADVIALPDGQSAPVGNELMVSHSGDVAVVSGSNGNGGGSGSKSFLLSECVSANGGLPAPPPQANPPPAENPPAPPSSAEEAASEVQFCMAGNQSAADFVHCLNFFAPQDASTDYYYVISTAIATFCAGGLMPFGLIAAAPTIGWWRRRRKKQDKQP